jgi:catechol 2,3-dioxygenase-like lactoylglutathione lyase family enzyme
MITAMHALLYSDDPPATRRFLSEVLGWPAVEHAESGDGWLIFRSGPSETGVHPTRSTWEGREHVHPRGHQISLMCDDVVATRAELESAGATFVGEIEDHGYGLVTMIEVPGIDPVQLYQPTHPTAFDLT